MKTGRRGFIAALFAPIVARFLPVPKKVWIFKPRSVGMTAMFPTPDLMIVKRGDTFDTVRLIEVWDANKCPFVRIDGKPWPWENKSNG